MSKFSIGEKVLYRGDWGNQPPVVCTIVGSGYHKGRLVYDNDLNRWGYEDQYEKLQQN